MWSWALAPPSELITAWWLASPRSLPTPKADSEAHPTPPHRLGWEGSPQGKWRCCAQKRVHSVGLAITLTSIKSAMLCLVLGGFISSYILFRALRAELHRMKLRLRQTSIKVTQLVLAKSGSEPTLPSSMPFLSSHCALASVLLSGNFHF